MKKITPGTLSLISDLLGVGLILFLLSAGCLWFISRPIFLLRSIDVQIEGNRDAIRAREVANALKDSLSGTYFTVDLGRAAESLEKLPWVRDVAVSREWPNQLRIELILHQPIAIWGDGKVLAKDGTIFVANEEVAENGTELPHINGPEKMRMKIFEQYHNFESVCSEFGYKVVSLDLEDFGGWVLRFRKPEGKIMKLTLKESATSEEMVKKLRDIIQSLPEIKTRVGGEPLEFDARYTKGIAVVKPQTETDIEAPEALPGERKDGR